jgi:hypothetical protein
MVAVAYGCSLRYQIALMLSGVRVTASNKKSAWAPRSRPIDRVEHQAKHIAVAL